MDLTSEKIAIVTDSAADIAAPLVAQLNITVIHTPIVINQKKYYEDIDIDCVLFSQLAATSKEAPIVGQVSLASFEQVLGTLKMRGYSTVICVLTASGISSLVSTMNGYLNVIDGLSVHVFDSQTSGVSLAQMVQFAGMAAAKNVSAKEILAGLAQMRAAQHDIWVVGDMRGLLRTGYIAGSSPVFSNRMMRLKTLLTFNQSGQLEVIDTQFRMKKACQYIKEHIVPDYQTSQLPLKISVAANSLAETGAVGWLDGLRQAFGRAHFTEGQIKPSLAAHTGKRAVIVSWGLDCHSVLEQYMKDEK